MANSNYLISVIVTTYNRPQALDKVIASLMKQTDSNFEVVIADDGSKGDTRRLIESWKLMSVIPVHHAWQEDLGFRAGASRNNAVRKAKGDYLIFLDGDCIVRPNFIAQHRLLREEGFVVAGNRCLLNPTLSKRVEEGKENLSHWNIFNYFLARLKGEINRLDALLTLPPSLGFRYKWPKRWERVRSCNMAVSMNDFKAVNGFDESFVGWGFEDSDLAVRLLNLGLKVKRGMFATAVLHLYHRESEEVRSGPNWERFQLVLKQHLTQPIKGLLVKKELL